MNLQNQKMDSLKKSPYLQVQNLEFFFLKESIFKVTRPKNRLLEKFNNEKKIHCLQVQKWIFFLFLQGVFFLYCGLARPKNGLIKKKHRNFFLFF
jgi:hypothetical protein